MKLWHQSFAQLDKLPAYVAAIREHLDKVAAPGTTIDIHGMRPGSHTTMQPGKDIGYSYVQHMHSLQFLDSVRQAEKEGYDAYLLSTIPDPYLQIAQSVVDIPVVGLGFSSMHTAAYVGRKFGIVTFIKEMPPLYQDNIRKYGLERLGGPVRHLGLYFDDVQAGFENPQPVVDKFVAVVREMIEQDGIDVVIPGELPMHLMLHRAGCHRVDEVPVIDGLGVTVKMAEMLVSLRRTSGLRVNRQNYFYAKPADGRFDELKAFYQLK